jgi:CBS domain-containing protein
MSVGRICTRSVVVATPEESVRDAAKRMSEHNVGSIVVVSRELRPVGMLTDRDITLRCVAPGRLPDDLSIGEIMTAPARSVVENTAIDDAAAMMRRLGVRRLPVTNQKGVLVGLIALDDLLELIIEETSAIGSVLRKEAPVIR